MNKQEQYEELLTRDNTHPRDIERRAMFYIFSHNNELYGKVNRLYDFKEHWIENENEVALSSSGDTLKVLAFNLYNNFSSSKSVSDIFSNLDDENFEIAMQAIRIRFGK